MTFFALNPRKLPARLAGLRIEAMLFAALALLALAAVIALWPAGSSRASVSVQLTPAKAAALVAATSAAPSEFRAVGDEARAINASLPFSNAPVQSARPFEIGGGDLDHRRALLCLTQAIYYEAASEPLAGRRAVAQVVLNRMRHPAFPKSVCGVVYQGSRSPVCQFSFVCDGSLYRAPASGLWKEAKQIAEAALEGFVETSVGSATHYHADYVAPRWAPKLTKISKLGAHIFYRWPGAWGQRGAFSGRYIGEPQDPLGLRPPLRAADSESIEAVIASGPIMDGTILKRAPNDVGGLLDTSKGWTLNIPDPRELGSTPPAIAEQKAEPSAPAVPVASSAAPVVASR
jgi:hypothetical protein